MDNEKRIEELEAQVKHLTLVVENLTESVTSNAEAIIEHIASLESDRDTILESYTNRLDELVNKHVESKEQ